MLASLPMKIFLRCRWVDFFVVLQESEEEWFWPFEPFSKFIKTFCAYCKSIKIKVSLIYTYEKEIKFILMVQQLWLWLKMNFLLGYNMEIVV